MALNSKIEGNELDLSLNQLVDVPVKDLAKATKATCLDLSNNHIELLPSNFVTLTHLVKLDLSRNRLTELPHNFGNLTSLHYLDLYGNQLSTIPISFCRLKNLRWLDLKNNPLTSELQNIAGDCLDVKQCQMCAKNVVAHMQTIESNLEREKQKKLKEERELEAILKAQEEKELLEKRKQKKAEKEKRKAETRARLEKERAGRSTNMFNGQTESENDTAEMEFSERVPISRKKGFPWATVFVLFLLVPLLVATAMIGIGIIRGRTLDDLNIEDLQAFAMELWLELRDSTVVWWNVFLLPQIYSLKVNVLEFFHSTLIYVNSLVDDLDLSLFK